MVVNASRHVRKGRPKNYIPDEDISSLAAAFQRGEPVDGQIAIITTEQAARADYNLSPSRWAGQTEAVAHRPIKDILADLQRLDNEAHKLDASLVPILANLR